MYFSVYQFVDVLEDNGSKEIPGGSVTGNLTVERFIFVRDYELNWSSKR